MTTEAHGVPLKSRWLEDYRVGEVFEFGDHRVTQDEVIGFAQRYDAQPFHTDPEAARQSSFGTLVASGWMTGAIGMALMVAHFIPPAAAMGSPGIEQLQWLLPVKPGDRLRMRATVLQVRRSASKPDRGLLHLQQELLNQAGQTVMRHVGVAMMRCRSATDQDRRP